ncbi:ATP-binding cassette domain-containing protein [Amphritea sp. 1_MG-2023]|uniref:amino acid ABC transporter ATP-binding/permease protein n=1 Tax=Amphritea sp. 1_MG-2023 TaxID=3062670 RepID=UPI0026E4782A|nr:ATP-binding cassette domain-containing protein [Amphritea sp. 1_MG-2023]MDO6562317.1 ATP-binding cassette domain-containing protein [Amphritea sp. 1_MG-2023]
MPKLVTRYFQLLWQQRGMASLGLLLAIITALSGIALLAVSGWFISATAVAGLTLSAAHGFNYFAPGAVVRGLSISRTFGRYGERLATHEATFRVISHLRSDMFAALARHNWQEQPLNSHEASGRLLDDIRHAEALYLSALVPGFVMLLSSLLYLATIALFLPSLALWLILPVFISVVLIPMLYLQRVLQPQNNLHQQRNRQWSDAHSLFSNLRTLILFDRLSHQGETLTDSAHLADTTEQQTSNARQQVLIINQLVHAAMLLLVLWQGLNGLAAGELAGTLVFMLLLLTLGVQEVIVTGSSALAAFALGYKALERIDQLSPAKPQRDLRLFNEPKHHQPHIVMQAVQYRYPSRQAATLSDFNATLDADHWYWLTSPSGQGKTTLLQLLAGRLQPQQGKMTYTGLTANQVAMMPQQVSLLQGTLRFNLCLHHDFSDAQLWQALQTVELNDWAKQLPQQLDTWLGAGTQLPSGGELKRLGLARLLLLDRSVILMDEPTAGIDTERSQRILERLRQRWSQRIIVISSHDIRLMAADDKRLSL